jgi:hypothetical protein
MREMIPIVLVSLLVVPAPVRAQQAPERQR